jgi:two-component system LytT family response regulator
MEPNSISMTPVSEVVELRLLAVRSNGRMLVLRQEDIDWVEAEHNYVRLHTRLGEHLIRETMAALGARLDPNRFRRIHRSTIINIDRIVRIEPIVRGDAIVELNNGCKLNVSRNYRNRLWEPA